MSCRGVLKPVLLVAALFVVTGCADQERPFMRDSITSDLGYAVNFNKACQTAAVKAPAGCKRGLPTGQAANQAVTAYDELLKQPSTLRVTGEADAGGNTSAAQ